MGAFSFKERFVEPVLAGLQHKKGGKRQTIRNFRKRPLKVGERVVLYYAQRTKHCKRLGEDVIKSRQVVRIDKKGVAVYDELIGPYPGRKMPKSSWFLRKKLKFSKSYSTKAELNRFARADGFKDFEDMKAFWIAEHGKDGSPFPYSGNLYKW